MRWTSQVRTLSSLLLLKCVFKRRLTDVSSLFHKFIQPIFIKNSQSALKRTLKINYLSRIESVLGYTRRLFRRIFSKCWVWLVSASSCRNQQQDHRTDTQMAMDTQLPQFTTWQTANRSSSHPSLLARVIQVNQVWNIAESYVRNSPVFPENFYLENGGCARAWKGDD